MAKEATPIELTDEEVTAVLATVETGEQLPCGGHAWPGPHNKTTPVVAVKRGATTSQLSLRPILWRHFFGEAPGRPVYSVHEPPCCEHLSLDARFRTRANRVSVSVEAPELFPAEPAVGAQQERAEGQQHEPQQEPHGDQEAPAPSVSVAEPPTSTDEAVSVDEPRDAPYGGGPGSDRGSDEAHPWQLAGRRRPTTPRRSVAILAAVALLGLLWPAACQALARAGDDRPDVPVTATTEPTTTPPPIGEAPPSTEAATTTAWTTATMPPPCTPTDCPTLED